MSRHDRGPMGPEGDALPVSGSAVCALSGDTPGPERELAHLRVTLDSVRHGLMMFGPDGTVHVCNRRALNLLGLPPDFAEGNFSTAEIAGSLASLTVESAEDPRTTILTMDDRQVIEIHADPLAGGGAVMVVEDVTQERNSQAILRLAEAEYRSLFENAVCGIYRDRIDGSPVRANKALVNLNGYETESEYLAAIGGAGANWYVEPGRAEEFHRLMRTEGRVHDFVSEVYRHRTRERIWITENAWYVRDATGNPLFIEGTIQDATERVRGLAAIESQLNTDALTGAASRFHFMNTLNALTRDAGSIFVLFTIDLDHFKDVNDNLGHGAGDTLLKTVVARLRGIAGPSATVGRLGGDEFAVVIPGRGAAVSADLKARQIVNTLKMPIEIDGHNVTVGASVGVACYPAQASDANELLTHADLALYHVKSNGRDGFRVFDLDMKTNLNRRKGLARELREAIVADELELFYQPIVHADTAQVAGYEALMRWRHPRRGLLAPGHFIEVAEESGLMTELGNWAIRTACRQGVLLPDPINIAVNVSPNQFRSAGIVDVVKDALKQTGLAPSRLTLEVTETVILSSESIAPRVIDELIGLGIRLALDDFGTGYSSLSYLQTYAFSKVKVDRSFVAGIDRKPANLAIIRAVIGLAADLGIDVVAEGIETAEQSETLAREKCAFQQGYLFGKPKPFLEVAADHAVHNLREWLPKPVPENPASSPIKRPVHNRL